MCLLKKNAEGDDGEGGCRKGKEGRRKSVETLYKGGEKAWKHMGGQGMGVMCIV